MTIQKRRLYIVNEQTDSFTFARTADTNEARLVTLQ